MHPKLADLLNKKKPGKRGIHGTANAHSTPEYYVQQFDDWQKCGFSWLKLLAAGDSQLNTVRRMNQANLPIIPIIRFWYGNNSYPNARIAPDLVKPYVDEGVVLFDVINEPYLEWAGPMPGNWPDLLAHQWGTMADAVLRAGGVPMTPSIEGWRYFDIFEPFMTLLLARSREQLEQSVIAMHNRPLNHPINYDKDPGGYRGWEWMDRWVLTHLGQHLPLVATEAGPEPGWDQDSNFPRVTNESHADMCMQMLNTVKPDYYLADCFWIWEDTGAFSQASWRRNPGLGGADLPVVARFKETPQVPVEITVATGWKESEAPVRIREWCWNHAYQGPIAFNPSAAFQRGGQELGAPVTPEMHLNGWAAQGFALKILFCREGDFANLQELSWHSKEKGFGAAPRRRSTKK